MASKWHVDELLFIGWGELLSLMSSDERTRDMKKLGTTDDE